MMSVTRLLLGGAVLCLVTLAAASDVVATVCSIVNDYPSKATCSTTASLPTPGLNCTEYVVTTDTCLNQFPTTSFGASTFPMTLTCTTFSPCATVLGFVGTNCSTTENEVYAEVSFPCGANAPVDAAQSAVLQCDANSTTVTLEQCNGGSTADCTPLFPPTPIGSCATSAIVEASILPITVAPSCSIVHVVEHQYNGTNPCGAPDPYMTPFYNDATYCAASTYVYSGTEYIYYGVGFRCADGSRGDDKLPRLPKELHRIVADGARKHRSHSEKEGLFARLLNKAKP